MKSLFQALAVFAPFSLASCGIGPAETSSVLNSNSTFPSWATQSRLQAMGGYLEKKSFISSFDILESQLTKNPEDISVDRCASRFEFYERDERFFVDTWTHKTCLWNTENFEVVAKVYFNGVYHDIALQPRDEMLSVNMSQPTRLQKMLFEAQKKGLPWSVRSRILSFYFQDDIFPSDFFEDLIPENKREEWCATSTQSFDTDCLEWTDTKINSFELQNAPKSLVRRFIALDQAQKKQLPTKTQRLMSQWKQHIKAVHSSAFEISLSRFVEDLARCEAEIPAESEICLAMPELVPLVRAFLLPNEKDIVAEAMSLIKSGQMKSLSDFGQYQEEKLKSALKAALKTYQDIIKLIADTHPQIALQSNYYLRTPAQSDQIKHGELAFLSSPLKPFKQHDTAHAVTLKGVQVSISQKPTVAFDLEQTPTFADCRNRGSIISLGQGFPFLAVARKYCDESLRPLPTLPRSRDNRR